MQNRKTNAGVYNLLENKKFLIPAGLFFCAFLIRLGFLALSDNFLDDQPMLNIITALHIFTRPHLVDNVFLKPLPLYLYTLALSIKLGFEQILSARFLSLFFGSATIVLFYKLVEKIYNEKTAFWAGLLFCFLPLHVKLSTISVPDVMALFFIVGTLFAIVENKISGAAFCVLAACACSYMPWMLLPVFPVAILIKNKERLNIRMMKSALVNVVAVSFAVGWYFLIKRSFGIYGIFHDNFSSYSSYYSFLFFRTRALIEILKTLSVQLSPFVFAFCLVGVFRGMFEKKGRLFFIITGMTLLIGSINVFRHELYIAREIHLFLGMLLMPFLFIGIESLAKFAKMHKKNLTFVLVAVCIVSFMSSLALIRPSMPVAIKESADWIKHNVPQGGDILVQKDMQGFYTALVMYSGLPQSRFKYFECAALSAMLENEKSDYIILSEPDLICELNEYSNEMVIGKYLIYKIKK